MPGFGPIGSAPISALPDSGVPAIELDLGDAMSANDAAEASYDVSLAAGGVTQGASESLVWPALADAISGADGIDPKLLPVLIERLTLAHAVTSSATLSGNASVTGSFTDTVLTAWQLLLAEDVVLAGDATANITKVAALVDALAATGQASSQLSAFAACVQAMAMEGLIAQGFAAAAVEQALLADASSALAKLLGPLADALMASDTAAATMRLSVIAAESAAAAGDISAAVTMQGDLADGAVLYASLRIGDIDYAGWALNTTLKAATEYRQYPFDSFATYRGKHYMAGPNGIVRRGGTTDDGQPIDAWIRTALMDLGTGKLKRVPDAFIAMRANGDMVLKVVTQDATGAKVEDWYAVTRTRANGPGTGTVEIGRGLKSTWWQFELHNVNGADFALEELALRPLVLARRN